MPDWAAYLVVLLLLALAGTMFALRAARPGSTRTKSKITLSLLLAAVVIIGIAGAVVVPSLVRAKTARADRGGQEPGVLTPNVLPNLTSDERMPGSYAFAYAERYYECVFLAQEAGKSFTDAKRSCSPFDIKPSPSAKPTP